MILTWSCINDNEFDIIATVFVDLNVTIFCCFLFMSTYTSF